MSNKILIFTSKTGGGHVSLAEALRDMLQDLYPVEILDPQPSIIHTHYRLVSRHALRIWAAEFQLADTPNRSLQAHKTFTVLFARNVGKALKEIQPDLVMTTYPFLSYEVTYAMRKEGLQLPFVMLFSDPNGVHQSWLTERNAEANFAPTQEVYDQALRAGFDRERLHLTGWPVRAQFYRIPSDSRPEMLQQLGFDEKLFTVFLQGGGEGAARFVNTVENLLGIPNIQVILAAGTNEALITRFSNLKGIKVIPFTRNIAPFMNAADVVMGKAGPNMLFEAVTLGKPFIATAYIPGQEQANLEFIKRHQLGWVALKPADQRVLVQSLATDPPLLEQMEQTVAAYRDWNNEHLASIRGLIAAQMQPDNLSSV